MEALPDAVRDEVDEERVLALLRSMEADLAFLRRESAADADRRADDLWLRGIEYTFVTVIEGCIDALVAAVLRWLRS